MKRNECLAMLLAGGQGSRLYCLTTDIAKPGLSFGGKYRIIDFSLSNCSNSGIDTVGVLTQYKPFLLNTYMGIGTAWDFDTDYGGMHVLPPYMNEDGGTWYKGTANAIYQNINFIDLYSPKYIVVLSGDHIYKMDYSKMVDAHVARKADATIAVIDVTYEEASRFGIMNCDKDNKIVSFEEKPKVPKSTLASMGIYVFSWDVLRKALIEDEADPESENDFGKNIIPNLLGEEKSLFAYNFTGYWKDVGTIPSYYEANMELLSDNPPIDLYESNFKISSNSAIYPSQYVGPKAVIKNSLISTGCTILGEVEGCVVGAGVTVGEGCVVKDSILLPGSTIRAGSIVEKSILGEDCDVLEGCHLGVTCTKNSAHAGITVVANNYVVPHGSKIQAGSEVKPLK